MRWADERYVRVYTRDTVEWVALGWEAQSLLVLTMRKVDRAGILDLGKPGVRGLAAIVGMPLKMVERAFQVLLDDGCVVLNGAVLVIPNFIEAQEAQASDAQRQREKRARDRDKASGRTPIPATPVTKRDEPSRNVTDVTDSVTPSLAVPSQEADTHNARAREDGAEAGAELREMHPREPHPLLDRLVKRLRASGKQAVHPKPAMRSSVEAVIREVGLEVALQRAIATWDPCRPHVSWRLDDIRGVAPVSRPTPHSAIAPPAAHEAFGKGGERVIE